MLFLKSLLPLVTIVCSYSTLAAPTPTSDLAERDAACGEIPCSWLTAGYTFSPDSSNDLTGTIVKSVQAIDSNLSNAQRLARGLPLKKPVIRSDKARRADPVVSPGVKTEYKAFIAVHRSDDNSLLGYVSKNYFSGAQARYQDITQALQVSFKASTATGTATSTDITTLDNAGISGGFTLFGLVQGRDDTDSTLAPGSYQYIYFASTAQTPPGSPPVTVGNSYSTVTGTSRTSESAVWNLNINTGALTPYWTNPTGSTPLTSLQIFTQGTALYGGGDSGAFASRYPSPVTGIYFKLDSVIVA